MGKGPEETFLQRRYKKGHKVPKKKLNITSHQANENLNHSEISVILPHLLKYPSPKRQGMTNAAKNVEKAKTLYIVGENIN